MDKVVIGQNHFLSLAEDFKNDTGLEAEEHMHSYIQYYQARMSEKQLNLMWCLMDELLSLSSDLRKTATPSSPLR